MLLILFPYKYTQFYHYLFEADVIKRKTGMSVEIHDLSLVINKGWEKSFPAKSSNNCLKFSSLDVWKKRFYKLRHDYKNLIVFNFLDINSINSLKIHYLLKKSDVKILRIGSPGVLANYKYFKKIKRISHIKEIMSFSKIFKKLFYILKKYFFLKIYKNFFILNETVLISGNKNQVITNQGKKIKEIFFHSFDYSKVFKKKKIKTQKKYILYFDIPSPFFLDDYQTYYNDTIVKTSTNIDLHYKKLNKFLKSIENVYSSKVIIIPHPKVRGIKNPYYSKNFHIDNRVNAAEKLIDRSKFIICPILSTVIAYAIAKYKPILFLSGNGFKQNQTSIRNRNLGIEIISNYLSCKVIDYEKKFKSKFNLTINKKKYEKYKYQFLTSKKISKVENYQIINSLIREFS